MGASSSLITTRPETAADEPFLEALFADIRSEELGRVPWPPEVKTAFLRDQFRLQRHHYRNQFREGDFRIILWDGAPIGRLYLLRAPQQIRIIDLSLSESHRRRGIGNQLLGSILAEAEQGRRAVRLSVSHGNPALNLYLRLGFVPDGPMKGHYLPMVWRPGAGIRD